MSRALRLGAILLFALTPGGCAERPLDDDVRNACVDTCAQARRCDLAPEDTRTQDECVQDCIPSFQDHRDKCESALKFLACVAALSCEDQRRYEAVIMGGDLEQIFEGDYPCNEDAVADQDDCF